MVRPQWFIGLTAALVVIATPLAASADTSNFIITDFSADYYLSKADPQGALDIQEHLNVTFNDYNHGILRALPQRYNGQSEELKVSKVMRDGNTEPYTTYNSNGNEVLKIGSASQTITGNHSYEIDYSVKNVVRFTGDHDELDWNTNGTEWTQPFEHITARLHLPGQLASSSAGFSCFTGAQGSTAQDCTTDAQGTLATFTTSRALDSGETMTFAVNFTPGTFQKPTLNDWLHDHFVALLETIAPVVLAFAVAYPYWRKNGKDIKGRGTIVPEYAPPGDLRAAEADVINHYKLGNKAISATIIDLAIRKYLKIIEAKSNGVLGLGKHKVYTFQRLPEPPTDNLKQYERQIYEALFPIGDITEIGNLKNSFYITAKALRKDIPASLVAAGYFPKNPILAGAWLHGVGAVAIFAAFYVHSLVSIGLISAGIVLLGFGALMPRRTQKGVDAKDQLAGLKLYMEVAEKDRMAMLQAADAPYAERTTAPQQTVELFEKLLPYAIVMGVEKSWARQFQNIYAEPPDWYAGNWTAFNAGYLVGSLNDSIGAMNSSFAAPASSGSGMGGGFAGGGGGGGGGGGW